MSIEPAEAPEPRRTGHRGVDLLLGLSAVAISCVSMFVAYHTSHSMERLVQANSWPFLQFGTGNADREGSVALYLTVSNVGTGPARIHEFEMSFNEEPKPAGPTRRSAPARRTRSGRRWWPRARRATPGTGRGPRRTARCGTCWIARARQGDFG